MPAKRIRVCVVTGGHWAAVMGGAQYQAKCLVDELVSHTDIEVVYLARDVNPSFVADSYELLQIARPNRLTKKSFLFDAPALLRLLAAVDPDVVYQRGLQPYTGIIAYFCRRNGRRFIFQIAHDFDVATTGWDRQEWRSPLKGFEMRVSRYGLRNATHVIAQTFTQAELLRKNFGREASGVMGNFHPLPEESTTKFESPLQVVWIANFKPFKRPEVFVNLAEDLADLDGVRFVMIGRSGNQRRYGSLVQRIRSLPNLDYRGELSLEEVNRVLGESHIFVNTSIAEGFPNTFVQAWLRRVAVVSLEVDTDGVLDQGRAGFLVRSYENLKSLLRHLVSEPSAREAMAASGEAYARMHHSSKNAIVLVELVRAVPMPIDAKPGA